MKQRPERKYSLGLRSMRGACSGVSSQCSSRRSSQKGSQPTPASRKATRSFGKRCRMPPTVNAMTAIICPTGCVKAWTSSRVLHRSTPIGTWSIACPPPWTQTGTPRRSASAQTTSKLLSSRFFSRMCCGVTMPTMPSSVTARRSSAAAASGSIRGSLATDLRRAGAWRQNSARASLSVRQSAIAKPRSSPAHSSPAPPGNMTVTSMPSRSMSSRRLRGSVMPGRERLSTRAVPRVSLTPTPGRFANCCFTRSRRAAMCGWNSRGRRSRQSAGSPPWPSASITKWPNLPMGAPSEGEDAAREPPATQIIERSGELVERVAARDELVDLEPAAEVEVGEHREVAARAGRPVAAAEDRLVLVEGVDHEVERRADLRHADDGERAARTERVERLADDGEAADRLEGVVGAPARQVADRGDGVVLRRVDRVRGAETTRQLELRGHDVDGDDPGRAREHAALHAGEADAAEAEDGHRGAGLDARPIEHRTYPRHDAAADQRRAVERHAGVDRDRGLLAHHGAVCERRRVRKLIRGLAVQRERPGVLGTGGVAAFGGPADLAGGAATAVGERREDDRVALLHGRHAGADGVHHARALVAEDDGRGVGDRAVDHAQVRVTEAGGADRDLDLAGTRVAEAHLLDGDRLAGGAEDGGLHDGGLPILSTRPGRSRVSWPCATIVFPLTMTRAMPSGRTCQRSSPPGMSRTSCFLPRPMRVGSNIMMSAGQPRTRMPRVRMPVSSAGRRVIRRTPSSSGRIWRSSNHERM